MTLDWLALAQATALASVADSVSDAVVTVSATLVANAYDNTHYVLATSGANAGQWSEVVTTAANSITTAEVLLAAGDTFEVIPFWTLATAFPGGEGVGVNTNPNAPTATVLINDPTAVGINLSAGSSYLYFEDGVNDGWYDTNTFAPANDLALVPDTYLTIRNNTASPIVTVTLWRRACECCWKHNFSSSGWSAGFTISESISSWAYIRWV